MCVVRANQNAESPVSTRPLSGIGVGQHDVERRDPVGRDEQQPVVVERVELADLAAAEMRGGFRHERIPPFARAPSARSRSKTTSACRVCAVGSKTRVEVDAPGDLGVVTDELAEVEPLVPRAHRMPLHEPVGLVTDEPRLDEREQQALAEDETVARLEVLAHALDADDEPVRRARRSGRACSRRRGTSRAGRPARPTSARCRARARARRSRSPTSAFARTTRARPQIRSAVIGLRLCGIADEPFCAAAERLLDLAHLGAREVADLGREAVERRGDDRERREHLRVPVALQDLRRRRRRLEPEPLARDPLHLRVGGGVRSRRRPRACRRASPRARAAGASRSRSSVNAQPASLSPNVVGSAWTPCVRPDRGCRTVLLRARDDGAERPLDALEHERTRPAAPPAPAPCRSRRTTSARSGTSARRGPSVSATASTNAATSWSGLALELGDPLGRRRHGAARGSPRRPRRGSTPTCAHASSAASSTSSQRASFASSDQMPAMAGRE